MVVKLFLGPARGFIMLKSVMKVILNKLKKLKNKQYVTELMPLIIFAIGFPLLLCNIVDALK